MFMFTHDCSACDRTQLIFPSMITGATRTDAGTQTRDRSVRIRSTIIKFSARSLTDASSASTST